MGTYNRYSMQIQMDPGMTLKIFKYTMFLQKSKTQAITRIKMYPTSKEGKVTGHAQEIKCKLDTGAGANVMSLKDYKRIKPSEFGSSDNSVVGFQDDQTTLKGYGVYS